MAERGVCICPNCGCQFSDDGKARLESQQRRRPRWGIRKLLARDTASREFDKGYPAKRGPNG